MKGIIFVESKRADNSAKYSCTFRLLSGCTVKLRALNIFFVFTLLCWNFPPLKIACHLNVLGWQSIFILRHLCNWSSSIMRQIIKGVSVLHS